MKTTSVAERELPSITWRAPTHTTAAVPTAISDADHARVDGLQRVEPQAGVEALRGSPSRSADARRPRS